MKYAIFDGMCSKNGYLKIQKMIFRKIAFILLIIWWGAFSFYAGIVIPVGMNVLGSHIKMGFITQEVSNYLNYFGLPIFLFSSYIFRTEKWFFRFGILLVFLQIILFVLHIKLDYLLDFQLFSIKFKSIFYPFHRIYLLISTLIWLLITSSVVLEIRRN